MELLVFKYGRDALKVLMYGKISPLTVELVTDELLTKVPASVVSVEVNNVLMELSWRTPDERDRKITSVKWTVRK